MDRSTRVMEIEPHLSTISSGDSISVVATLVIFCPGSHLCEMLHTKQSFRTDAALERDTHKFTILDGEFCKMGENHWINQNERTVVLKHPPFQIDQLSRIVEVCSGIGAVGVGFHANHAKTVCYNDNNPKFCQWLSERRQAPVVCGDVSDTKTVAEIFSQVKGTHVLTAGVSCQPFSRLGDQQEENDERSKSLLGTLLMAYYCQSMVICLECTPTAMESKWVQQVLQDFCTITKFQCSQKILKLSQLWPAERNRWWATLSHPSMYIEPIDDLPAVRFPPTVMHLVSKMLKPPTWVEDQIKLDEIESHRFVEQKHGIGKYFLQSTKAMPTATHSWGSQLVGCKCGCRTMGFKQSRLNEKGLHAVLIPMETQHVFGVDMLCSARHLLPQEVALFNGLSPDFVQPQTNTPIRLDLAGVGQMASPLQSGWVFGGILYSLQKQGLIHGVDPPRRVLANMCRDLILARNHFWDRMNHTKYMEIFEKEIHAIDHPIMFPAELEEPEMNEEEGFTQALKTFCPIAEEKLKIGTEESEASVVAISAIASPQHVRKGKGGCIPRDEPPMQHPEQITIDSPKEQVPVITYATSGGIPGFEVRNSHKRPMHPPKCVETTEEVNPQIPLERASKIPRCEHQPTPHEASETKTHKDIGEEIREDIKTEDPANKEANHHPRDMQQNICVWTAKPLELLQPVSCSSNATVGQLAMAEAKLQSQDTIMRPTSLVGTSLSLSSSLEHEQVVLLDSCLDDFVRCPKQSCKSSIPDLTKLTRFDAIWHQQGWVAWDEMEFYLKSIDQSGELKTYPPIDLTKVIPGEHPIFSDAAGLDDGIKENSGIFTVGWVDNHWFPIHVVCHKDQWSITTTTEMKTVVQQWCEPQLEDFQTTFVGTCLPTRFGADCGFQSFGWIIAHGIEATHMFPMNVPDAIQWRLLFAEYVAEQNNASRPFGDIKLGGALDSKHMQDLVSLLELHGVAQKRLQTCASQVIQQLGTQAVQAALGSGRPWKDLKAKASALSPPLQLVYAEELQVAIQARIQSGKPFGRKQNKRSSREEKPNIQIDAGRVHIPPAIFQQQDGTQLSQILPSDFHNKCRGVAVVNIQDAIPFFQLNDALSKEGVGLLILDYMDDRIPNAHEIISFPANCPDTGEPIILTAAILQLGQQHVSRFIPSDRTKVEEIPTEVLRIVVFRDQCNFNWNEFIQKPVKHVMTSEPGSQLHQDDVIDVWDRQFLSRSYQKANAADAEMFLFTMRLTQKGANMITTANSSNGMYIEPRSDNGRDPKDCFRVVWLPKRNLGEVRIAKQTAPVEAWVVRHGERYGLRVAEENAKQMHELLRPEVSFIDGKTVDTFRLGPLPFGTTRQSLLKLFKCWEWQARPGQPVGQSKDHCGIFWTAQSAHKPSHWVFTMEHGDVLISVVPQTRDPPKSSNGLIVASKKTIDAMKPQSKQPHDDKSKPDPWLHDDPWTSKQPSQSRSISVSQIAAIETNVQRKVLETLQNNKPLDDDDAEMKDTTDQRVHQLESQVQKLTDNMASLNSSMSSFHNQQQHVNSQLNTQIGTIKNQVEKQHVSMQAMLDTKMEEQMNRIEALLTKRAKHGE